MSDYTYAIIGWRNNDIPIIMRYANTPTEAEDLRESVSSEIESNNLYVGVYDVTVESGDFNPDQWRTI